jgi:hypothetical protein
MLCHPERSEAESKDPVALSFVLLRDSSTSLGMTSFRVENFCASSMEISGNLERAT